VRWANVFKMDLENSVFEFNATVSCYVNGNAVLGLIPSRLVLALSLLEHLYHVCISHTTTNRRTSAQLARVH
jgi:hypothetical protein